ncbi:mitochondrial carrier [Hesseltinella vesiculosa]|uniref:Mitochondrial carrier n=1 Tax=Hesseltinella vesiculosa TaxID=101127 RepID=A0A1X2G993_9FUNG|nr:mitochondrial carrier [Hesseltinella vesiculosa]
MATGRESIVPLEQYKLPPVGHAISGAVGSLISNFIIYPIDISTTRIQLEKKGSNSDRSSLLAMIKKIYNEGGIQGLYTGLAPDSLATVLSSFIYFYCYSALRNLQEGVNRSWGRPAALNIYQELFLGAEAALISRFFTSPVSNITTRLQASTNSQDSFAGVAKHIYKQKGITGFWTGYRASMVLVSNPSITYFVFEKLKALYLRSSNKPVLSSWHIFFFSAFAKSIATMITYPFIFIRANMIASSDKGKEPMRDGQPAEPKQRQNLFQLLRKVVERDGPSGVYKGMRAQITKGFFNSGILFLIKDYVATYLTVVFYAAYKMRQQSKLAN